MNSLEILLVVIAVIAVVILFFVGWRWLSDLFSPH
jgi:heme/copper-type cytochrome/quinol oxidase subunit 2